MSSETSCAFLRSSTEISEAPKASFERPQLAAPVLRAGSRRATGVRMDTAGEFYSFDIDGLEPQRSYTLELSDSRGNPLCDPWPITSFPSRDAQPATR